MRIVEIKIIRRIIFGNFLLLLFFVFVFFRGGSHSTEHSLAASSLGLNLSSAFGLHNGDHTHHHLAPTHHHLHTLHNNNNNSSSNRNNNELNQSNNKNNNQQNNSNSNKSKKRVYVAHYTSFMDVRPGTALNLSKGSTALLNKSNENSYNFIKPELNLAAQNNINNNNNNNNNNGNVNMPPYQMLVQVREQQAQQTLIQTQQLEQDEQQDDHEEQEQHHEQDNGLRTSAIIPTATVGTSHDTRVTSTHNENNNTIASTSTQKTVSDEADGTDANDNVSAHSGDIANGVLGAPGFVDEVEELDAIDADFPYPFILDSNSSPQGMGSKRRRRDILSENEDDDDDYETQMIKQHRRLRRQQLQCLSAGTLNSGLMLDIPPPQTVREVLNSKFCGFISAKLNSMEDSEADNLMNKILMLLVQTQTNEIKQ